MSNTDLLGSDTANGTVADANAAESTQRTSANGGTKRRAGLTGMVLAELRELAGQLGITGTAGMRNGVRYQIYGTKDGHILFQASEQAFWKNFCAGVGRDDLFELGSNGGFCAVLLLSHNWADWEATKKSYELMARYVHPHFQRQANTLRVASYDNATAKHATAGAESANAVMTEIERYEKAKGQGQGQPKTAAKAW